MSGPRPHVVIVAGSNGAGKSTAAPDLLRDALDVDEFVNADAIAAGLSAFRPETVALAAGRLMLQRIRHLAARRANCAFETTLASRSFAPFIVNLKGRGYRAHLLFLGLKNADLAVDRVATRVRLGGHDVPEATVRRRFQKGLRNLFGLYLPLVDTWQFFENSGDEPRLVAAGKDGTLLVGAGAPEWQALVEKYGG